MTIQTATPRRQTRLVYRILHDMLLCTKCCMDIGRVAQLVEQVTFNHWVTGSNPVALTTSKPLRTEQVAAVFCVLHVRSLLPI